MTIRSKVLIACLAFMAIVVFVLYFSSQQERKLGEMTLGIYDEAFIGVSYSHKAQAEFIRLIADHAGGNITLTEESRARLGRIIDNIDVAIERAMSRRGREIADSVRGEIIALRALPPGAVFTQQQLQTIDRELGKLVNRYGVDGFTYRTHSAELVIFDQQMLVVVLVCSLGLALLTGMILLRAIIPPINRAVKVARAIENGKLDNMVSATGKSETDTLLRALGQMQLSIAENIARIEEETRSAERERIANQTKSEFLTNMSHELRTPMHAILGFSRQALKRVDATGDEKLATMIGNIQVSGARLLALLNDLLDLAKLEAGKIHFDFRRDTLRTAIDQTLRETDALAQAGQIRIYIEEAPDCRELPYDFKSMVQVFVNLFSNAIKFSPAGSDVMVSLRDAPDAPQPSLLCSVRDSGIGIPPEELELVFDKYVQSSKTKSGAGGTGLGLAIVRQIIEAHGGTVWAENAAPKGACFKMLLPYEHEPS